MLISLIWKSWQGQRVLPRTWEWRFIYTTRTYLFIAVYTRQRGWYWIWRISASNPTYSLSSKRNPGYYWTRHSDQENTEHGFPNTLWNESTAGCWCLGGGTEAIPHEANLSTCSASASSSLNLHCTRNGNDWPWSLLKTLLKKVPSL